MHDNSCFSLFLEYNNMLLSSVCSCFKIAGSSIAKFAIQAVHEAQIDIKAIYDNAPEKQGFQMKSVSQK